MFMLNNWYAVAQSHEIGRSLLPRMICGQPMVFYRRENGRPVALEDMCWHRLLPLSKGRLEGDHVHCKYHGLLFNAEGRCTQVPSQDSIPPSARVRRYPTVDKHRFVWVWPGDPEQADESRVPDLHWFADPAWNGEPMTYHFKCDYRLVIDNLLDLSHETYVHPESIGSEHVAEAPIQTEQIGDDVVVSRWILDHKPATFWRRAIGSDKNCDRWQIIRWTAPSTILIDVGVAITGTGAPQGDRSQGISQYVINTITPETETSCWYFFGNARNYKIGDRELTQSIMKTVAGIFNQDKDVLEAQQRAMLLRPDRNLSNIDIDAGSVRARRVLRAKIAAEAEAQEAQDNRPTAAAR